MEKRSATTGTPETPPPASSRRRLAQWAIVLLFGIMLLSLMPFHEPWRDEAHSWMAAREMPFWEMTKRLAAEYYPPAWHYLLYLPARSGLPYETEGVINAALMTGAVALLVFFSPFAFWQKVAVTFSVFSVIIYGTVWRCYSLYIFALFAIAALFPARHRRPLTFALAIVALSNSHALGLLPSLFIAAAFAWETWRMRGGASPGQASARRNLAAVLLLAMGVGGEILLLLLYPSTRIYPSAQLPGLAQGFRAANSVILITYSLSFDGIRSLYLVGLAVAAFLLVIWSLRRDAFPVSFLLVTYTSFFYIFSVKINQSPGPYHPGLITMTMVACLWMARAVSPGPGPGLGGRLKGPAARLGIARLGEAVVFPALLLTILRVPGLVKLEVSQFFSGGREMATFIRRLPPEIPIATFPSAFTESVAPFLHGRPPFWSLELARAEPVIWATREYDSYFPLRPRDLVQRSRLFPGRRPLLLLALPLPSPQVFGYRLLFSNTRPSWGFGYAGRESFWLYAPTELVPGLTGGRQGT